MTKLIINDLEINEQLSRKAMQELCGKGYRKVVRYWGKKSIELGKATRNFGDDIRYALI